MNTTNRILEFASDAGVLLLQSGGETYRVEETVERICAAYNLEKVGVFATPTAVIVSASENGDIKSVVKRIKSRKTDLNKLYEINSLSRNIAQIGIPIEESEKKIREIEAGETYSSQKIILFSGIAAAVFTVLFGGGILDMAVSFLIGCMIRCMAFGLGKISLNDFFINMISAAMIAVVAIFTKEINFISSIDKVIMGSIMLLVPGLPLTNAIRDILDGELLSGGMKIEEVLIVGIAVTLGMCFMLNLYIRNGGI